MVVKYIKKYWVSYLLGMIVLLAVDYLGLLIPEYTGDVTDGLIAGMGMAEVISLLVKILFVGGLMALGRFGWRERSSMNCAARCLNILPHSQCAITTRTRRAI